MEIRKLGRRSRSCGTGRQEERATKRECGVIEKQDHDKSQHLSKIHLGQGNEHIVDQKLPLFGSRKSRDQDRFSVENGDIAAQRCDAQNRHLQP